jgi:hypothetical protein
LVIGRSSLTTRPIVSANEFSHEESAALIYSTNETFSPVDSRIR